MNGTCACIYVLSGLDLKDWEGIATVALAASKIQD